MALYERKFPYVDAIEQPDGNFLVSVPERPGFRRVYSPERFHNDFKPVVVIEVNLEGESDESIIQESSIRSGEECNGTEGN